MFTLGTDDLQYIFGTAGQSILVNDIQRQAIITNPSISEYEERYIHTLDKVSRGDLVTMDNEKYICITETVTKRHSKYKSLARHCNYTIEIPGEVTEIQVGETPFGDPIYEYIYGDPYFIPSIVDNKTFSVDNQSAVRLANNQIEVILQNNAVNTQKFAVNFTFNVMNKNWKVINIDKSKNGLLILTCELTV